MENKMKYLLLSGLVITSLVVAKDNLQNSTYLDYAASAHINSESLKKFIEISKLDGNSSGFNPHAQKLKQIENESAKTIAKKIGCNSDQILFTNSATISNNVAILGVAYKNPGCHLITSKIEHKSVLNVFKYLEKSGYRVTYIGVDRYGNLDLEELKKSIRPTTRLVSIQSFNSEIGTRQDVAAISKIIKNSESKDILFHSDISQAFGKYPTDFSVFDMATFSGYKIGAPKGIAALYVKDRKRIAPIVFGSGDELFPGSKPTALIAAFAKAVEMYKLNSKIIERNFNVLKKEIQKIDDVYINSEIPSHVFSVSIKGVLLKDLIDRLQSFSFSSGCSCLGQGESNVKEAIDPKGKLPSTTLRISFSDKVPEQNLIDFARSLKIEVEKLRKEKSVSDNCQKEDQKDLSEALSNLNLQDL
jgi:cysteine desulfurase